MDLIRPELSELSALEFAKIAESDFVYTIASTNVDQLIPNNIYDNEFLDEFDYGSNLTNIWSYLPLNKETLFNLTLFTL